MQVANILVLQGHFKVPFLFFLPRLYCTDYVTTFNNFQFFYSLTSFYVICYILELFVDWAHNVNYWTNQ